MASVVRIPLRDEILAIRELFGYSNDVFQPSSAHGAFNLGANPNSSMKDVLLIGLDIDTFQGYEHLRIDPQLHISVSILDTRALHHLFVVGDSMYCRKASQRFMFGESQSIPLGEVKMQVESLVCSRGRDNIVVFHGDHSDLKALANLDIQLKPLYIIDNVKAAQYPLGLTYRLGLEAMLDTFDIPYANLHAAGNNAHYALRSLLMIAVTDRQNSGSTGFASGEHLFSTFSVIAHGPRPTTAGEEAAALQKFRRQLKAEKKASRLARRVARRERRIQKREAQNKTDNQCSAAEDAQMADMSAQRYRGLGGLRKAEA
ncbi:hypothetical protein F5Y16DRAFT_402743 [Xylariaceae sp. FL0255]|nr:hypothetical protein F5Y16DRAFT_402743 [Xylariaceae sp. FL0255]